MEKELECLSKDLNALYGYVTVEGDNEGEPAINSGPCGPFANAFYHVWNQIFIDEVTIVFVMVKDSEECWHVAIRLPNGKLFDGGVGVHEESAYDERFELVEMKQYDYDLLDKHSYGLDRTYPRYCPTFSIEAVKALIQTHLQKLKATL